MTQSSIPARVRFILYLLGFVLDATLGAVAVGFSASGEVMPAVVAGGVAAGASIAASLKLLAAANSPADLVLRRQAPPAE